MIGNDSPSDDAARKTRCLPFAQHGSGHAAMDALSAHICILDDRGIIVDANRAWRRFAAAHAAAPGTAAEGSDYLKVCAAADGPDTETARAFADGIREVIAGTRESFELVYPCHAPGEPHWFIGRITRYTDVPGTRVVVAHEDITALIRAREDLRLSESRFRTAFENAAVGMAFVGADGHWLNANAAMAAMLGCRPEALIGKPVAESIHPEDMALHRALLADLVHGRTASVERDLRFVHRSGALVHAHAWTSAYRGETGEFLYGIALIQNVTAQVEARQEREQIAAQLLHAQKMEAIGTMAGGIAHDFNNILSAIVGNAELLSLAEGLDPASADGVRQILTASKRARDLVRQILAFSRYHTPEKMPISLKPIVREAIAFLRASFPATIQIRSFVDPEAGIVLGNPTQLQQVVMNLCTNALHAMEADGGILELTLVNVEDVDTPAAPAGRHVKFSVTDSGQGIPPEIMSRIFDPYFTTKREGKGTGLGLSVVHGIVASHGGIIRVESSPGRGTTFHVFLPRTNDGPAADEPEAPEPPPKGSGRILLVDDEEVLIEVGRKMLEALGYTVEAYGDPRLALAAFESHPERYDVVLTDMTMPYLTGLNLARKITAVRPVPVVLCTGFTDQLTGTESGIRALLNKPLVMRELAEALKRLKPDRPRSPDPNLTHGGKAA